jgi:hypothetical protein
VTHSTTAKKVRVDKESHPERYCEDSRCLWRVSSGPCPKHPIKREDR